MFTIHKNVIVIDYEETSCMNTIISCVALCNTDYISVNEAINAIVIGENNPHVIMMTKSLYNELFCNSNKE